MLRAWIPGSALAGYKMEFDENRWISLGIGLRFEAGAQQESGGGEWDKNFTVDSIRPYIGGQVHEYIKFEVNLDYSTNDGDSDVQLLDGIVKFEFNDQINIWGGRFLPPTDRANFSGSAARGRAKEVAKQRRLQLPAAGRGRTGGAGKGALQV